MVTQTKQETRDSKPQENIKKFKEVLLYVLESIGARPNIGESVICKLMYFIDFDFYEIYEEQIMGLKYLKNHHGPTPKILKIFLKFLKQWKKM